MGKHRIQFEGYLNELKEAIILMGEQVEHAIEQSVQALRDRDMALAEQVIQGDTMINEMEERIDNIGTRLIATQQPVAKDLRRILIAFKIASDLERMGDLAVDVAKAAIRFGEDGFIKPIVDIVRMAELAGQMTRESIHAFTGENIDLAYKMAKLDDEVDELHSRNMQELFAYIAADQKVINQALLLAFVSRYLERMADHATNIGESVVYLVKGKRPDLNQ